MGMLPTYLGFCGSGLIVTVGRSAERSTGAVLAGTNAATFGEILFSLSFADLDLLFLSAAPQLLGLERIFGLELRSAMLGDVSLRHGVDGDAASEELANTLVRGFQVLLTETDFGGPDERG